MTWITADAVAIGTVESAAAGRIAPARHPSSRGMTPKAKVARARRVLLRDREAGVEERIARGLRHHAALEVVIRLDRGVVSAVTRAAEAPRLECAGTERLRPRLVEVAQRGRHQSTRRLDDGEDRVRDVLAGIVLDVPGDHAHASVRRRRQVNGPIPRPGVVQISRDLRPGSRLRIAVVDVDRGDIDVVGGDVGHRGDRLGQQ